MIYFEIFFVLALGALLNDGPNSPVSSNRRRAAYIVCSLALFWFIAALRNVNWVATLHLDAQGYASSFAKYRLASWDDLFEMFVNRYRYHYDESDIGFMMLCKLIGIFTDDYNYFCLVVYSMFFIPFGFLLYRYTVKIRQLVIALVFYIALIQIHLISGARQMLALGLDIAAIMSLMDRKIIQAFVLFAIGLTIHFSSMLMIIPLLLILFDVKPAILKIAHSACLFAAPLVFLFPNQVIIFVGEMMSMEKYANYGTHGITGGASTFIILLEMLSVFCYFALDQKFLEERSDLGRLYSMVPLLTITAPLIHSNGSMIRICMYYYVYITVLMPYGFDRAFDKRTQTEAYGFAICALVFLYLRGGVMDYHFMWQQL